MNVVHTPDGLPGFDSVRRWELEDDESSTFSLLRNLDEPSIGLLVTSPWDLAPGYEPDLPDDELARLGVQGPADVAVLVVATIAGQRPAATDPGADASVGEAGSGGDASIALWLNLAAPIVLNSRTMAARQVILDRQGWPLRHPIVAGV